MKREKKLFVLICALTVLLSFVAVQPCKAQAPAPTDLGVLDNYLLNLAAGINSSGQIVGLSFDNTNGYDSKAIVWKPGETTPTVLPLLSGDTDSEIGLYTGSSPINDSGLIAGNCFHWDYDYDYNVYQACVWEQVNGDWTVNGLGVLPDTSYNYSEPYALNASGQVVGESGDYQTDELSGFIWDSVNGMQPFINLPTIEGFDDLTLMPYAGISENGYVAGDLMSISGYRLAGAIWDSSSKHTIGYMQYVSPQAISPSGLVACYDYSNESDAPFGPYGFVFIWNYNNGQPVRTNLGRPSVTIPDGFTEDDLSGIDIYSTKINDDGQIIGYGYSYWNGLDNGQEFYWMWDGTQFIDLTTVLPSDLPAIFEIEASINASGQVAFNVVFEDSTTAAYLWDGDVSNQAVALEGLGGESMLMGINNSGQLAGTSLDLDDSLFHACAWGLSIPTSALDISNMTATSPNQRSPLVTVTLMITNPSTTDTAYDVTVTAASLNSVETNSKLPLVYGAIKPGESKKCTLQFKNVPSGEQILTLNGTSSLGDFSIVQTLDVP